MRSINSKQFFQTIAAASLALLGSSAFAASTWALNNCSTCTGTNGAGTVTVTAVGVDNSTAAKTYTSSVLGQNGAAGLGVFSGTDSGSPTHAVDNNLYTDALLLNFGTQKVDLDFVKIGWHSGDADISVFRYTGGSATPTPIGLTMAGLAAAGWTLVGNYADLADNTDKAVNTTNTASSWWLLSAYSTAFGSTTSDGTGLTGGGSLDNNNDYFKVAAITGTVKTQVPEPGSIALLGLGLVGLVASRRRGQKSA